METGEKKFINGCISREIIKIILKLVITIGLTFLAVRYDFFVKGIDKVEYGMGLLLTFCIVYFLCSVMQFLFQTCHFIVTAFVTGVIAIIRAAEVCIEGSCIYTNDPKGKASFTYKELTREVLSDDK